MLWKSENNKNNDDSIENTNDEDNSQIEIVNNRIYLFSDINQELSLTLSKDLRNMSNKLIYRDLIEGTINSKIYLHINSPGGCLISGLNSMDNILTCKVPIISVIEGYCASAATLISIVAKERYINKNSYMLIHEVSSFHCGKYKELKDQQKNTDHLMKKVKDIYNEYTKIPKKVMKKLLDSDLYLDSKKCLEYGLVDDILT